MVTLPESLMSRSCKSPPSTSPVYLISNSKRNMKGISEWPNTKAKASLTLRAIHSPLTSAKALNTRKMNTQRRRSPKVIRVVPRLTNPWRSSNGCVSVWPRHFNRESFSNQILCKDRRGRTRYRPTSLQGPLQLQLLPWSTGAGWILPKLLS